MKLLRLVTFSLLCFAIASPALAVDRDAKLVDSLSVMYREYDQMEVVGALIQGEQRVTHGSQWSIIADIGYGKTSTPAAVDPDLWLAKLGLKKYINDSAAVSIFGQAEWVQGQSDFRVTTVGLDLRYRILPAEAEVSPYVSIQAGHASGSSTPWTGVSDDFSALVATVAIGWDIMLARDTVMSLEVRLHESASISGGPYARYADGMTALLGFKYYWMN